MEKQLPEVKPLEAMDMHAPVEVTITVRMVLESGETARVMYDMRPGQIPTRAEIEEAIKPALDVDLLKALPMQGNARPMTKPEFVAFITKRAAGQPIPMAGDQHFVPAPCEIPHAMLVHAVAGTVIPSEIVEEYEARGLILSSDDYPYYYEWVRAELDKQPDDVLLALYKRVTA